jgi:quinol monooxygenase YgiN
MIFIVVKFTVRPERVDDWPELVADFTNSTRQEPGNVFFEWSKSLDVPNQFVLVEGFADGDAGSAHVNSDHFKTAMAALPAAITRKPDIINVQTDGTGWSEMAELTPTSD